MGMQGGLRTMSVAELLQWAHASRKTGTLEIEHDKVVQRIAFRDGGVVACSSDDPAALLGQYLLSRGRITPDVLRDAMKMQESTGTSLGQVLVEMGILGDAEINRFVAAKAEESLYGLFDLDDGVFRFFDTIANDPNMMAVHLDIEELLVKGGRLQGEMDRIRAILQPGTVLHRTNRPLPEETAGNPMARRLCEAVDGQRTIAEILLHTRAAEFLALKFLFQFYSRGLVKVLEHQAIVHEPQNAAAAVQLARQLVARGDYEAALDSLENAYRRYRGEDALRRMIPKVESVFVERCYRHELPAQSIPVLVKPKESLLQEELSPHEFFLISTIENESLDVKSLSWVSPMREVDLLRMLKRLIARGVVELRESRTGKHAESLDPDFEIVDEGGTPTIN